MNWLIYQLQHSRCVYDQDCIEMKNKKEEIKGVEVVDVQIGKCYEIIVTVFKAKTCNSPQISTAQKFLFPR